MKRIRSHLTWHSASQPPLAIVEAFDRQSDRKLGRQNVWKAGESCTREMAQPETPQKNEVIRAAMFFPARNEEALEQWTF